MSNTMTSSQWPYKLVKCSSTAALFGLALASTLPSSVLQAATASPLSASTHRATARLTTRQTAALPLSPQVTSPPQPAFTLAQSVTPAADGTGTLINQTDNTFDITGGTQSGSNLFHSFEQLGLTANETANILSSPDINNILGRVVGGNASVIDGLLQVTGSDANLFLVNPAGIIFGPNSQVLVPGAFTATTANGIQLEDAWFNALGSNDYANMFGDPSGFAFTNRDPGMVINAGNISAPGERVTLLGGVVVNTGTIETSGGTINISAVPGENSVEITPEGSLLTLALPADSGLNTPSQNFTASDLPALLSGTETAEALGVVVDDGVVKLVATDTPIPTSAGTAIASGILDASDASVGGVGGAIDVLGDRVGILDASINTSGASGGGDVRLGGGFQGKGPVANADRTYVDATSQIIADGLVNGDGGQVIVWADDMTRFVGEIFTQGGNEAGDGGFVEVSGKQDLIFRGTVDAAAPNGNGGTLLLDPEDIIISNGGMSGNFSGNSSMMLGQIRRSDDTPTTLSESQLESESLASVDIILEATRDIIINDLDDNELTVSSSDRALIFEAGRNFSMNADDTIKAPGRPLTITAESIRAGNISTSNVDPETGLSEEQAISGDVTLVAPGTVTTGSIYTGSSAFSDLDELETGSVLITSGESIFIIDETSVPTSIDTAGQSIKLQANNDILTGILDTNSFSADEANASVTLTTEQGDIQIAYIDAGSGGIDISAAGSFRATGSFDTRFDQFPSYPPELIDFIVSLGYDRNEVLNTSFIPFVEERQVSLLARPSLSPTELNAPITIRYGDATRTIENIQYDNLEGSPSQILILGDSSQAFVLPPVYTNNTEFFVSDVNDGTPLDPANLAGRALEDLSFSTGEGVAFAFPSDDFPANASGLSASIVIGSAGNSTLYGSSENQLFEGLSSEGELVAGISVVNESLTRDVDGDATQNLEQKGGDMLCDSNSNEILASESLLVIDENLLPEGAQSMTVGSASANFLDPCKQAQDENSAASDASESEILFEPTPAVEP
ncbi:MAG: filamentous hemagglutinin N-terminal domain-containing protein [Cyanobacteria bacterium J06634_5]